MVKKSIYISKKADKIISFLSDEQITKKRNYSRSINEGLILLDYLMEQSKPTLFKGDWLTLYDVYAGREVSLSPPLTLVSDVRDYLKPSILYEMNCRNLELIKSLKTMHPCRQIAILWHVKKYLLQDISQ